MRWSTVASPFRLHFRAGDLRERRSEQEIYARLYAKAASLSTTPLKENEFLNWTFFHEDSFFRVPFKVHHLYSLFHYTNYFFSAGQFFFWSKTLLSRKKFNTNVYVTLTVWKNERHFHSFGVNFVKINTLKSGMFHYLKAVKYFTLLSRGKYFSPFTGVKTWHYTF